MKIHNADRIWNGISLVLMTMAAAVQGLLLWQIRKLNMLPGKYFLILCGGCLAVTGLLCLLLFRRRKGKWEKKAGRGRQIVGYVLALMLLAGCFVGSRVVGRVSDTLSSITAPEKVSVVLEVYVRSDDPAEAIEDTAGYRFALSSDISRNELDPVLAELKALLMGEPKVLWLDNAVAQMNALFSGEVEAVVLNSAYLPILEEMDGYADYASRIKLLHKAVVEKEVTKPRLPSREEPEENEPEANSEKTGFLCYVSGVDNSYTIHAIGRSDVNILVAVNPVTHQILMVNTPRDYYVVNPASGTGAMDKLTHCGLGGVTNSMEALGILYGHMPEYSARINFAGFETLVDAIGGVTIYSDVAFTAHGGTHIRQGTNHLNGRQALGFARTRKVLAGGDNARGKNQMKIIAAIVDQLSASNLLQNYDAILQSLEGMFVTSMPVDQIGMLVQRQITEMPKWEIYSFAVTGDGGSDSCWAAGGGYAYVMYPHEDVVAYASQLMEKVLTGEVLTQEDMTMPK